MAVELRWVAPGDEHLVASADHLFDEPTRPDALAQFLADDRHHLCIAFVDGSPAGFVSGVAVTHPDKGTEMFLYELGVDDAARGQGLGRSLVSALAARARELGCYGMWVLTGTDNEAARRTYRSAGADEESVEVMLTWTFDD